MTSTAALVEFVSTWPKTWKELSTWMNKKDNILVSTGWTLGPSKHCSCINSGVQRGAYSCKNLRSSICSHTSLRWSRSLCLVLDPVCSRNVISSSSRSNNRASYLCLSSGIKLLLELSFISPAWSAAICMYWHVWTGRGHIISWESGSTNFLLQPMYLEHFTHLAWKARGE